MNYLEEYYSGHDEDGRLASRHGSVEYLTSLRYIHKYLPRGASVLDVGAGTGRYAIALAREGYEVAALELLPHNIERFKANMAPGDRIRVEQGNALDLSRFPDGSFDGVLLFGPMYHLYTREDKLRALAEAKRVAREDGTVFVAYCMNEATIIQWGFRGDGANMRWAMEARKLTDQYQCISIPEDIFEMVRLEDIDSLNREAGLARREIVATDLFTCYIRDRVDAWSDEVFSLYLDYHFAVCSRPDLIGLTNHALDIVKKK